MQSSFALTEVDDEASVADAHFELAADCASKSAASSGAMWETLLSLLPSNFLQPATRPYTSMERGQFNQNVSLFHAARVSHDVFSSTRREQETRPRPLWE